MIEIRQATAADVPRVLELVRALATYEKEPDAVVATEADFLRDGFGEEPAFRVKLACEGSATIGFALYFFTFSTWRGRKCLYLEDLFVDPPHRGKKAGIALMQALAAEAVLGGSARFCWQVLDWNKPAIDFYEKLGARVEPQWWSVRLEGAALAALAQSATTGSVGSPSSSDRASPTR